MTIGIPESIIIIIHVMAWGVALAKHGEPRLDDYNFFFTFPISILTLAVLYWGGFFS